MLNKYGLQWILMSGGVLLGKLVRYGYPHQIGTQLEAARMAAELLCCIFSASATHPQRRVGFSCYTPMEVRDDGLYLPLTLHGPSSLTVFSEIPILPLHSFGTQSTRSTTRTPHPWRIFCLAAMRSHPAFSTMESLFRLCQS